MSTLLPPGARIQPTKQGLDCRELIKILQELVQGVTGVRCDGVLVLEQELDSARDESAAGGCKWKVREGHPSHPRGDGEDLRFAKGQTCRI